MITPFFILGLTAWQFLWIGIFVLLAIIIGVFFGQNIVERIFGRAITFNKEIRGSVANPANYVGKKIAGQIESITIIKRHPENPLLDEAEIKVVGEDTTEIVRAMDVVPRNYFAAMAHNDIDVWENVQGIREPVVSFAKLSEEKALKEAQVERMHSIALEEEINDLMKKRHKKELEDARTFSALKREVSPSGSGLFGYPYSFYRRPYYSGLYSSLSASATDSSDSGLE